MTTPGKANAVNSAMALWITSVIAVGIVWRREADIGRRPWLWAAALALGPLICVWVLSSRILHERLTLRGVLLRRAAEPAFTAMDEQARG
jgi:hypothetical protein